MRELNSAEIERTAGGNEPERRLGTVTVTGRRIPGGANFGQETNIDYNLNYAQSIFGEDASLCEAGGPIPGPCLSGSVLDELCHLSDVLAHPDQTFEGIIATEGHISFNANFFMPPSINLADWVSPLSTGSVLADILASGATVLGTQAVSTYSAVLFATFTDTLSGNSYVAIIPFNSNGASAQGAFQLPESIYEVKLNGVLPDGSFIGFQFNGSVCT